MNLLEVMSSRTVVRTSRGSCGGGLRKWTGGGGDEIKRDGKHEGEKSVKKNVRRNGDKVCKGERKKERDSAMGREKQCEMRKRNSAR